MRGVAAPEAGGERRRAEAEDGETTVAAAEVGSIGEALRTAAAGEEGLDGDAIAGLEAPALGGGVADLVDDADGLVAGDDGVGGAEGAFVLFVVAAADAAGFDAEDGVVAGDVGDCDLLHAEIARSVLDDGAGVGGHAGSVLKLVSLSARQPLDGRRWRGRMRQ